MGLKLHNEECRIYRKKQSWNHAFSSCSYGIRGVFGSDEWNVPIGIDGHERVRHAAEKFETAFRLIRYPCSNLLWYMKVDGKKVKFLT